MFSKKDDYKIEITPLGIVVSGEMNIFDYYDIDFLNVVYEKYEYHSNGTLYCVYSFINPQDYNMNSIDGITALISKQ